MGKEQIKVEIQHIFDSGANEIRVQEFIESYLGKIRTYFADYRYAEGCSCCRNIDAHKEAEKQLAILLNPEPYIDGSGWEWEKYRTTK